MRLLSSIIRALTILLLALPAKAQSQEEINRATYIRIQDEVAPLVDGPAPDLIVAVAKALEGTEYVASTLEDGPENLRIFMDKTDCILFVEMCVALTLAYKGLEIVQGSHPRTSEPSYELFRRNTQNLRYRNGVVDGYASRLHYTSEWIQQGEANGVFREITSETGRPMNQKFNFMSTHPDSYRQLKGNPENVSLIQDTEHSLESRAPYFCLAQDQLQDGSPVREGDILAFVSGTDGLDITHVAIACRINGEMHFIHASSRAMKVITESQTLAKYARNGIRVARLII